MNLLTFPKIPRCFRETRGMSLVEILVTVSILGILAAIGIAAFSGVVNAKAKESTDRRNAQNLVSIFQGGQSAGISFYVDGDLEQTVDNIVTGSTASIGVFAGSYFGLPNLDAEEKADAMGYLSLGDGLLIYDPLP